MRKVLSQLGRFLSLARCDIKFTVVTWPAFKTRVKSVSSWGFCCAQHKMKLEKEIYGKAGTHNCLRECSSQNPFKVRAAARTQLTFKFKFIIQRWLDVVSVLVVFRFFACNKLLRTWRQARQQSSQRELPLHRPFCFARCSERNWECWNHRQFGWF